MPTQSTNELILSAKVRNPGILLDLFHNLWDACLNCWEKE